MDSKKELKKRLWLYEIFFVIFAMIAILRSLGLYSINNNIINSFTIGTFLFTISDLSENERSKKFFLLLGMFAIIALPNCSYILSVVNEFIKQDVLMLFSLCLVFFSLIINEQKSFYNERKEITLDKLLENGIKLEEMLKEQLESQKTRNVEEIKNLIEIYDTIKELEYSNINSFNKILEDNKLDVDSINYINNVIHNNESIFKDIDKISRKLKKRLDSRNN
ncbi:hypothetical protein [Clostridium perfringens]|uniref:hypothetical protein n=1 Tax=Clostridium perfringens TaxID=1502 RepID=UPI000DF10613|nr:hypothetical protein [Clostridium perfringens]MDU2085988.1 hypothetical protein [Clostridium perfringens]NGT55015.1 hypothetical protein [Clostridium perfringens]STB42860.1 Uncharacterised protein [Clostridium perfringens]HBI7100930.1 hypothetical protein [Clostridium perfringens]HBI7111946.1 hypothetical protein [Clostridium perfringens]